LLSDNILFLYSNIQKKSINKTGALPPALTLGSFPTPSWAA
jgi:hypothetical protein